MKSIVCTALLILMFGVNASAQLNEYKYIVVPKRFEAFKSVNQHNTSVLVKYLLSQEGFSVVYDDAQPMELRTDPCLGVYTKLNNTSSLLATKVIIDLVDCENQLVYTSQEGKSKKKDYKEAYAEAIDEAMWSFRGLDYEYYPSRKDEETTKAVMISPAEETVETVETVETEEAEDLTPSEDVQPVADSSVEEISETNESVSTSTSGTDVWYAQELDWGYQLVDSTPKVRMKLYKTSLSDVYLAESEGKKGVVYQKEGEWWFEFVEGDVKQQTNLTIRF